MPVQIEDIHRVAHNLPAMAEEQRDHLLENRLRLLGISRVRQFQKFPFELNEGIARTLHFIEVPAPDFRQVATIRGAPGGQPWPFHWTEPKAMVEMGERRAVHQFAIQRHALLRSLLPEGTPV